MVATVPPDPLICCAVRSMLVRVYGCRSVECPGGDLLHQPPGLIYDRVRSLEFVSECSHAPFLKASALADWMLIFGFGSKMV